jgi:hypothetical protein
MTQACHSGGRWETRSRFGHVFANERTRVRDDRSRAAIKKRPAETRRSFLQNVRP